MSQPSIQHSQIAWVLGVLCLGAPLLLFAAYLITLAETDEVLDDSLRQTALLLADRDLALGPSIAPIEMGTAQTESKLVAIARRADGTLLFTSQPELPLALRATPGASEQWASGSIWHVYTVVQGDRVVQVAQPDSVRRKSAAEAASQLLLPLVLLFALVGALLLVALRRGLRPLRAARDALTQRSAGSLAPLDLEEVPAELVPLVRTLNDLLRRLAAAFEAQRQFVADAAHELRSPLTALQLQAQVLERSRDPAERAQAAREFAASVERGSRLIRQMLYLSRATADDSAGLPFAREPVRLGDLARSVVVRWVDEAERLHIDLGADVRDEATVEGDAAQLEILLGNLVENALRYTSPGGIVDVVAGTFEGAPTLRVIDNGPGIAASERERVFDRFYRGSGAAALDASGSGLGLAIVRAIAGKHRAVVSLHDGRMGPGLEVRVTFPAPAGRDS